MRLTRPAVLATFLFAAAAHAGGKNIRYLDLINRAHDSVISLEVAPAGSDAFQEKPLGAPLRGGSDSTTIEIAGESCLYDIRFKFRNGRTLVYKDVDICSGGKLAIRPLPRDTSWLVRSQLPAAQYAGGQVP
ncbi:hypothetical protein [Pseudoxanthomonas sacheonensis]|uniref:hypothetical protein n=1 Tax=Pseudoxanthomonas sacheonensis TaxID=443615 RepID=UPI0013D845B9|nr:hypothetical protein [Pseudoxanthomonas sacheonensis]KAF1706003.1 hypothetical protein CSC73_17685 [Pseudoxanthomonas sacheonensis]